MLFHNIFQLKIQQIKLPKIKKLIILIKIIFFMNILIQKFKKMILLIERNHCQNPILIFIKKPKKF
jgi:hypothetical protein